MAARPRFSSVRRSVTRARASASPSRAIEPSRCGMRCWRTRSVCAGSRPAPAVPVGDSWHVVAAFRPLAGSARLPAAGLPTLPTRKEHQNGDDMSEQTMTKVAVLGTGKMGGAIARRLKTGGFQVSVWDRTRRKAQALDVGRVADSPADATREAEVVISMVTGPQAVRDVYFGPAGVFEAAANKTIVEMSTAGPGVAQELAKAAKLNGATLIEAPVMGSVPAVNAGTLVILAGAARAD